jgi:hypothetical protein
MALASRKNPREKIIHIIYCIYRSPVRSNPGKNPKCLVPYCSGLFVPAKKPACGREILKAKKVFAAPSQGVTRIPPGCRFFEVIYALEKSFSVCRWIFILWRLGV